MRLKTWSCEGALCSCLEHRYCELPHSKDVRTGHLQLCSTCVAYICDASKVSRRPQPRAQPVPPCIQHSALTSTFPTMVSMPLVTSHLLLTAAAIVRCYATWIGALESEAGQIDKRGVLAGARSRGGEVPYKRRKNQVRSSRCATA